jgi:hypothetical protein
VIASRLRTIEPYAARRTVRGKREVVQHPLARRTDVALLEPGPEAVDLPRELCHEAFGEHRVGAEGGEEIALRIDPHRRGGSGDRVAVVGRREQRGLGEELPGARGVEHGQAVVDRMPDEPQPPAFDGVDRERAVALAEQRLSRRERAAPRPGRERRRQPFERRRCGKIRRRDHASSLACCRTTVSRPPSV